MSKVQIKVAFKDLKHYLESRKSIDVVLKSGEVLHVTLKKLEKDKLTTRNGLGHKRVLLLQDIQEMWSDKKAPVHQ
ncbi:MAG: hypothetical protein R8G66_19075 [Cytophagales bacterium]|nr:hypothetical protein [Cytophagales bacterium]